MTTMTVSNPASADTTDLDAPTADDGTSFTYEMLHAGFTQRAYANDPADLVDLLFPGYADLDDDGQWQARQRILVDAQVLAQAMANLDPLFGSCTPNQQSILTGPRHVTPTVSNWDCPVPLVLLAHHYEPAGRIPRPQTVDGMDPNIIWLDPSDDLSVLASLNSIDAIALHERTGEQ